MKDRKSDRSLTRQKLLAAASEAFAEKGYREATIAEICRRAGANIAAVNYHFGGKEKLYIETWRHCFAESAQAHPPEGDVAAGAPPEERLQAQVRSLLARVSDKDNREFVIVLKERANPTGLLHDVMRKELRLVGERMRGVIQELLGPRASTQEVSFCAISIVSQCLDPVAAARANKGGRSSGGDGPQISDLAAYADHVVNFSMAGMRSIREQAERKQQAARSRRGTRKPRDGSDS